MKEFLVTHYESKGPKWCAERTGRSEGCVKVAATKMGLNYARAKRERIRRYLRDNLEELGWKRCSLELGLAEVTTRRWAKKFGIQGPPDGRGAKPTKLTHEQVSIIRSDYPQLSTDALAKRIGLTNDIVIGFLKREGSYLGFSRRSELVVDKDFFEWMIPTKNGIYLRRKWPVEI